MVTGPLKLKEEAGASRRPRSVATTVSLTTSSSESAPSMSPFVPLNDASGRSPDSKKRTKTIAKEWQLHILRDFFFENQNPNQEEVKRVVMETGLEQRWIRKWFTRQRNPMRRSVAVGARLEVEKAPKKAPARRPLAILPFIPSPAVLNVTPTNEATERNVDATFYTRLAPFHHYRPADQESSHLDHSYLSHTMMSSSSQSSLSPFYKNYDLPPPLMYSCHSTLAEEPAQNSAASFPPSTSSSLFRPVSPASRPISQSVSLGYIPRAFPMSSSQPFNFQSEFPAYTDRNDVRESVVFNDGSHAAPSLLLSTAPSPIPRNPFAAYSRLSLDIVSKSTYDFFQMQPLQSLNYTPSLYALDPPAHLFNSFPVLSSNAAQLSQHYSTMYDSLSYPAQLPEVVGLASRIGTSYDYGVEENEAVNGISSQGSEYTSAVSDTDVRSPHDSNVSGTSVSFSHAALRQEEEDELATPMSVRLPLPPLKFVGEGDTVDESCVEAVCDSIKKPNEAADEEIHRWLRSAGPLPRIVSQ